MKVRVSNGVMANKWRLAVSENFLEQWGVLSICTITGEMSLYRPNSGWDARIRPTWTIRTEIGTVSGGSLSSARRLSNKLFGEDVVRAQKQAIVKVLDIGDLTVTIIFPLGPSIF
jgi:hypothetical protein